MADMDRSLTAPRTDSQPGRKGFRFGNLKCVPHLPHTGDGSPTAAATAAAAAACGGSPARHGSHFNTKQLFRKVGQWFETWMPWQRRILLCGTSDRCSSRQLEFLATALEPVFHRDFSAGLGAGKVPAPRPAGAGAGDTLLQRALQMATEGTAYEDDHLLLTRGPEKSREGHGLEEFAQVFAEDVIRGALGIVFGRVKEAPDADGDDDGGLSESQATPQPGEMRIHLEPSSSRSALTLNVPGRCGLSEEEFPSSESSGHLLPTDTSESDGRASGTEPVVARPFHAVPASQWPRDSQSGRVRGRQAAAERPRKHSRHWTFPGCQSLQSPLFSDHLGGQIATDSGTNFTPGYGTGSFVPLQRNKVSTLTWCMKHQRCNLMARSPSSLGDSGQTSHHHNSHVSDYTAGTKDFFQPKEQGQKLGKMYRALRTGQIKKPSNLTDVNVPLQQSFKNAKWWGREPSRGRQLVPARHKELKEHFKAQISQIWEWMQDWEDFEKGDLLVELIKMCDQNLLKFLAQCLQQRLRDRNDINCLPDKLLLHIFSFLPARDITMAERVCRRWRYIAAQDALWRIKCHEMGVEEGLQDLPGLVEEYNQGYSVDWRSAYVELCRVARKAKTPAVPTAQIGETGNKKWLSIKFTELMKKRTQTPESVRLTPIESESVSSEDSFVEEDDRKHSTVVDVPIHCMQAAVQAEESEEDDIEELTMSEFAIQGLAQDFDLFPELDKAAVAELPSLVSQAKATQSSPDTGQGKGRAKGEAGREAEGPESPTDGEAKAQKRKEKKKKKKKKKKSRAEDDVALDIRPELMQAKDILSDLQGIEGPTMKALKHPGWVKPVKRVRRLQGHTDAVFCLMFDKWRILTGSMDRTIRVWDIRSGRSIRKIYGHKGGIRCLQFDAERIVSGSWDMTVMVWDIVKFDLLATLTGHVDVVSCLQFDQNHLVTGSHDNTIRVWSMEDYRCLSVLRHHRDSVTCLVFDGQLVTSGSADRTIRVVRISNGECILKLADYLDVVTSLDVQGELIVGGTLAGKLFFWDKLSGRAVAGVQPHDTAVTKIAFLPRSRGSARLITAAGDGAIKEWDLYSMTCVRALHGHKGSVRDVRVSGDRIVSCSDDGNVRIWDLLTPPLRLGGDKGEDDTIETKTIDQRKDR